MSDFMVGQTLQYLTDKAQELHVNVFIPDNQTLTLDLDDGAVINQAALEVLENQELIVSKLELLWVQTRPEKCCRLWTRTAKYRLLCSRRKKSLKRFWHGSMNKRKAISTWRICSNE